MAIEDKKLNQLFSMSREAVIGVRGGNIVLCNDAARRLLHAETGMPGVSVLPEWMLSGEEESFVCTLRSGERALAVSGVRSGTLLLLHIAPEETERVGMPGGVLSEVRQSAYNLQMAAELISDRAVRGGKNADYSAILRRNYYSMLRLLRNIATVDALSREQVRLCREATDLKKLYSALVDSSAFFLRDKEIELSFEAGEGGFCLMGDREKLETLLLNLICNSVKACSKGGHIRVSLASENGRIVLGVDDDGKGIAPERLATVFALRGPEYSNADSAGLGLLVAQGIVQLHGGSLLIHGDEKKGTHVRAMLPATNNVLLRDDADFAPGASLILLELSPVLDAKAYDNRYRD